MLTVFAIPKAWNGRVATIQRNAVRSWRALRDDVQVVLLGDEPGTAAAAAELGALQIPGLARNELGTPRIDDAFARVDQFAAHPLRLFVNADIVLLDDFVPAVERVARSFERFLIVGETRDLEVDEELELEDASARAELRERALNEGQGRGATAVDYFAFSAGLFDPVPAFVVGRARFDNWLVWRARQRGVVVDATKAVVGVHQRHDYAHVPGGFTEAHFGPEAAANAELAGGGSRAYTIYDASHRLRGDGSLARYPGSVLRVRERARKAAWKIGRLGR
jgi:hypothetical protein